MRDDDPEDPRFAGLVLATRRLASPAEAQIAYLTRLGVAPSADELALEFDDAHRVVRPIAGVLGVGVAVLETLGALDAHLARMTGMHDGHLWTFRALRSMPEWERVRELARAALQHLPARR